MKTELKLQKGPYLIEMLYGFSSRMLKKALITEITDKAVRIKWEDGDIEWVYKTDFESQHYNEPKYKVVEKLNPLLPLLETLKRKQ